MEDVEYVTRFDELFLFVNFAGWVVEKGIGRVRRDAMRR